MRQKIAISQPGPQPTQDVQAVVDAAVLPLQQQIADLQAQLAQVQVQVLAVSAQAKPVP